MAISENSGSAGLGRASSGVVGMIAIFFMSAFLVAGAIAAILMTRSLERKTQWVEHAQTVRDEAKSAILLLTKAESASRGYLITTDENYRRPFDEARREIGESVGRLLALTAGNSEQGARVDAFKAAIEARLSHSEALHAIAAQKGFAAAQAALDAGRGFALMQEATRLADEIVRVEEELLRARQNSESRQRNLLYALLAGFFLSTIILACLAYVSARRQLEQAQVEASSIHRLNDELEARVRERTADLEGARKQAETETARAERERLRVELLLRDLNHRVGNNLSMVSAMLGMQAAGLADEAGKAALNAARERVFLIGSAQRRLQLGDDLQTTRTRAFFTTVVDDILEARTGDAAVEVEHDYDDVLLNARDAVTLAVVLGELVTNALKHAFGANGGGSVRARFNRNDAGVFVLEVSDDGKGFQEGDAVAGIGSTLVNELSRQFGGEVFRRNGDKGGGIVTIALNLLELRDETPPSESRPLAGGV